MRIAALEKDLEEIERMEEEEKALRATENQVCFTRLYAVAFWIVLKKVLILSCLALLGSFKMVTTIYTLYLIVLS